MQTNLLPLHGASVAGEEAGGAHFATQVFVVLRQRACETEAQCAGLTRRAAAGNRGVDIELVGELDEFQRLARDHARGFAAEEFIDRLLVDDDLAGAAAQENPRGRGLAATGSVKLFVGHCLILVFLCVPLTVPARAAAVPSAGAGRLRRP